MLVSKKRYEELERENLELKNQVDALNESWAKSETAKNGLKSNLKQSELQYAALKKDYDSLQKEYVKLRDSIEVDGFASSDATTSVTLTFDDDTLTEVKPFTRATEKARKKLVEIGYLASNTQHDNFAVNLALLVLGSEALEQLIFMFEERMKEINVEFDDE